MRLEKKATVVSTSVAAILIIIKMAVAAISGSVAILASAIDSLLDLSVSLFNYFALHNTEKDPDDDFNYGRGKLEPLAAVIEGTIITLSALYIFYEAIAKIADPKEMNFMTESIVVMIISITITTVLVLFLNYVAKKTNNMVIKADALHYKTDLFSNAAIIVALGAISITGEELIDPILGVGIAIYMIISSVPIIKDGIMMLLDASLPEEDINNIQDILNNDPVITDYHFLKTRESGSHVFISVHLVFNVSISLYDAHLVSDKLETKLKALFNNKQVHIMIHMDPYDDSDINEIENGF